MGVSIWYATKLKPTVEILVVRVRVLSFPKSFRDYLIILIRVIRECVSEFSIFCNFLQKRSNNSLKSEPSFPKASC